MEHVQSTGAAGRLLFQMRPPMSGYLLSLLCLLGGTLGASTGCSPPEPEGPSLLLITLDTTRADRLGIYGYDGKTSPNLDALAKQGVLFEMALAQASNTPVSHASILTGQFPYHHGLRVLHGNRNNRLPSAATTLAEHFRDAGYRTAAFVSAFPLAERFGLNQGFEHYDARFEVDAEEGSPVSPSGAINTGSHQRRADHTTDLALEWLGDQRSGFMLWVHYFDPHDPLVLPPEEFFDPSKVEGIQRDKLLALYDAEIRFMDLQIGRLVETLRESGQLDDTVIAVVADHGEGLGDHDWWTHGVLYQEQIRVPMILRGPGVPAGRRISYTVRSIDLAPTLLSLAGITLPKAAAAAMDGRSLTPLFAENARDPEFVSYSDSLSPMVYEFPTFDPMIRFVDERDDALAAIVHKGYKYIHHRPGEAQSELYDLKADPHEAHNLFAEAPELARQLRDELEARSWLASEDSPDEPMSREEIERLRALGYLGDAPDDVPHGEAREGPR